MVLPTVPEHMSTLYAVRGSPHSTICVQPHLLTLQCSNLPFALDPISKLRLKISYVARTSMWTLLTNKDVNLLEAHMANLTKLVQKCSPRLIVEPFSHGEIKKLKTGALRWRIGYYQIGVPVLCISDQRQIFIGCWWCTCKIQYSTQCT